DRECWPRREDPQAADGDHRLDDAARAPQSRSFESQPQAPHRGGLRHQARGHQSPAQDASRHGRNDEDDGEPEARADGRPRADDGFWRRHAEPGRDAEARRESAGWLAARDAGRSRIAADHARPATEFPRNDAGPWREAWPRRISRHWKEEIAKQEHRKETE